MALAENEAMQNVGATPLSRMYVSATLDVSSEAWPELRERVVEDFALTLNLMPDVVHVVSETGGPSVTALFEVTPGAAKLADTAAGLTHMRQRVQEGGQLNEVCLAGVRLLTVSDRSRSSPSPASRSARSRRSSGDRSRRARTPPRKSSWEVALDELFKKYARQHVPPTGAMFSEIEAASHGVDLTELAHFATDHQLVPAIVSLQKLKELYHSVTAKSYNAPPGLPRQEFEAAIVACLELALASPKETPPSLAALYALKQMAVEQHQSRGADSRSSSPPPTPPFSPADSDMLKRELERLSIENKELELELGLRGSPERQIATLRAEVEVLRKAAPKQSSSSSPPCSPGTPHSGDRAASPGSEGKPPRSVRSPRSGGSASAQAGERVTQLEARVRDLDDTVMQRDAQLSTLRGVMNKMAQQESRGGSAPAGSPTQETLQQQEMREELGKLEAQLEEALQQRDTALRGQEQAERERDAAQQHREVTGHGVKMELLKEQPGANLSMVKVLAEIGYCSFTSGFRVILPPLVSLMPYSSPSPSLSSSPISALPLSSPPPLSPPLLLPSSLPPPRPALQTPPSPPGDGGAGL